MVCGSDEEVAEKLAKAVTAPVGEGMPQGQGRPRFVWAQLRQLAQIYEERYAAHRRAQGVGRGAAGEPLITSRSPDSSSGLDAFCFSYEDSQRGGLVHRAVPAHQQQGKSIEQLRLCRNALCNMG